MSYFICKTFSTLILILLFTTNIENRGLTFYISFSGRKPKSLLDCPINQPKRKRESKFIEIYIAIEKKKLKKYII